MTRYRCRTCGGEYVDLLPDGYQYFHTCPSRIPNPAKTLTSPPQVPDTIRTPNPRDENIVEERDEQGGILMEKDPVKPGHTRSKRHMKAEGQGREVIGGE